MKIPFEKTLRQPPPRRIDVYSQMAIMFSGVIQQMGWLFVGMGMIFVAIFLPFSDWKFTLTKGPWEEVRGIVVSGEPTSSSVNDRLVWEYVHKFSFGAQEYVGESYAFEGDFRPGQEVSICVNTRRPYTSKIVGTQGGTFPKFIAFVLIFPLAGLFMVIPGLRKQAKGLDLLRNGEFTRATIKSKEPTGTTITINNRAYPVMKFTFVFEYQGQKHEAVCRTHLTELLEDEEQETILFYPTKPDFNIVYDGITNSPGMDPMGNFLPVSWTKAWVFLAPAFSIFMTTLTLLLFFSL